MTNLKKGFIVELVLIFLLCFYLVNRIGIPLKNSGDISSGIGVLVDTANNPLGISLDIKDLAISSGFALLGCIVFIMKSGTNQKKFRAGKEYGSARWSA